MSLEVTRTEIQQAAGRVGGHIRSTPVIELGDVLAKGYRLTLKLDHLQPTGSFKVRGAFSLLTSIEVPAAGVAAASGGNFGLAVAHACARLGHLATVFVPETSPAAKIDRISAQGADTRVIPGYYDSALEVCQAWVGETGAFMAHAYDQHEVVAGQGTVGMEIAQETRDVTDVLAAVGGGGLIAGIASWLRDDVGVVAVEPERCAAFHAAREAGGPTTVEVGGVAASSLGAREIGEHAWYANRWVDQSVLVTEESIVESQQWLWETTRLLVEPAAACTVAALMTDMHRPSEGGHVVAVLSGANVDPATLT